MTQGTHHPATHLSSAARIVVAGAGSAVVAALAMTLVAMWTVVGIAEGFDQHWLDVLYAVTGGVTFVMVFLIQHATGVQTRAVLLKLDELIKATDAASNDVIAAEQRPLHEQERLEERAAAHADT
jgi:low affinity Fe/Cu permease